MRAHVDLEGSFLCEALMALRALEWFQTNMRCLVSVSVSFCGKGTITLSAAVGPGSSVDSHMGCKEN